jgi:hypothetical protein
MLELYRFNYLINFFSGLFGRRTAERENYSQKPRQLKSPLEVPMHASLLCVFIAFLSTMMFFMNYTLHLIKKKYLLIF